MEAGSPLIQRIQAIQVFLILRVFPILSGGLIKLDDPGLDLLGKLSNQLGRDRFRGVFYIQDAAGFLDVLMNGAIDFPPDRLDVFLVIDLREIPVR